jgi:hypothetical protein
MPHDHYNDSILAATVLTALLVGVAACLALGVRRKGWGGVLLAGAVGGGLFQIGHFAEHVAQVGYWSTHRDQAPWMTPWANALARSFQAMASDTAGFGMEALHLVGNLIFLAGAAAILAVLARSGVNDGRRLARAGVGVQAVHVAEHIALTTSVVLVGRPVGVSTLFGTLDPDPGLWTYRVWWHLVVNAIGTALLALAVARRRHDLGARRAQWAALAR